ncbi:hypothetical protein [Blastococcus montanus]|uniref:hypothetical protein n=1 Tax=Blastococcus montanus TaxID=3144973 RepID=UPI003208043D
MATPLGMPESAVGWGAVIVGGYLFVAGVLGVGTYFRRVFRGERSYRRLEREIFELRRQRYGESEALAVDRALLWGRAREALTVGLVAVPVAGWQVAAGREGAIPVLVLVVAVMAAIALAPLVPRRRRNAGAQEPTGTSAP